MEPQCSICHVLLSSNLSCFSLLPSFPNASQLNAMLDQASKDKQTALEELNNALVDNEKLKVVLARRDEELVRLKQSLRGVRQELSLAQNVSTLTLGS